MPRIFLTKKAQRTIAQLDTDSQKRCGEALRVLSADPFRGEALLGEFKGLRRYRVGDLRIIYRLEKKPPAVTIIAVGHRREIYR